MIDINIVESSKFLSQLLEEESDIKRFHKLRTLYLLKTEKIKSLRQIAQILGRHRSTIQTWMKHYRQGGLAKLMEDRNERFADIPAWAIERLIEKFQGSQFLPTTREMQNWMQYELGVDINYWQLLKLIKFKIKPIYMLHFQNSSAQQKTVFFYQLESDIQEKFSIWKNDRGFPSDSQAINQVLGEFFNLRTTHTVNPLQRSETTLIESLTKYSLVIKIPYNIPELLIQNRLAERLKVDNSVLCRKKWLRTFPGWTQQRDPDGIGWLWVPELKKYRPLLSWEEIRTTLLAPVYKKQIHASKS